MNRLGKVAVVLAMAFSVGAAFGYTSASYVQDGLIAQWDGIDNAGRGQHDSKATVWKDLKGSYDLTVKSRPESIGGLWFDTYLDVAGCSAVGASAAPAYRTIEVVYRMTTAGGRILFCSGANKRYLIFNDNGTKAYFDGSGASTPYVPFTFAEGADRQIAGVHGENNAVAKVCNEGDVVENPSKLTGNWNAGNGKIMLGARSETEGNYRWYGRVYAIRLYDRELTDDELYQNAAIDALRFFGRSRLDVLNVRTSPAECAEAIAATPFLRGLKAGDPVALPVSAEWMNAAQTVRGVCTGYQFLVNGEVQETHTFAEEEPRVATYPATEDGDFVELVWLWDAEYRVVAEAKGPGSVLAETEWFASGTSHPFTLTATPDASDERVIGFDCWEDETGEVVGTSSAFSGVATGPHVYSAKFAATVFVAPDGDDANGGTSWAAPLATLSRALEVAQDGEMIVFDDGVYSNLSVTATTTINRPLTITSRNGRDKTKFYYTFGASVRALTLTHRDAVLRGLTLSSNRSTSYGAGALSITRGRFADGAIIGFSCARAASTGVAANLSGGTICNTVISNNYTYTSAGSAPYGVLVLAGGKAVADRCAIVDNEVASSTPATDNHGAVFVAGNTSLRNSLVARNKKPNRNSGVSVAANGMVDNCTIVGNTCGSTTEFGGVYAASGAIIRNTIIAGNTNQAGERNFTLLDSGAKLSNCCSPDDIGAYGESNKVAVPEFVDAANGDYRLAAGPCINGGEPLDWMDDNSLDLDGRPRTLGAKPDIGCYEKVAGKLTVSVVPSATFGLGELSVDFTASVDGADLEGLSYKWYLSGGDEPDFDGPDAEVQWYYGEPGSYTVRLEASNAAGEKAQAVYEDLITVAPSVIYVSKTSTPQKPYATWETAANTIEDAMAAAGAGMTVIVGDGEYPVSNVIMLDKDITLVSTNGPDKTFLQPAKTGNFQLVNMSDAGAVLSGFTLRNSSFQAVGMVGGGTVSNCVFRNNTGSNNTPDQTGGSGVCVSGAGNVITHCVFSNNTISVSGGSVRHGAAVSVADNATCAIDNCLFAGNALGAGTAVKYGSAVRFGGGSTGRVRNCLFLKNRGTGDDTRGALGLEGSGVVDVENCTFVGNTTSGGNSAGLYAGGKANVVNCLFADNTNASGVSNLWRGASATVTTCREADDLKDFKNAEAGDCRLACRSSCVDAGTQLDWMADATDLAGLPRSCLTAADIGCYELQPGELELSFTASVTSGPEPLTVSFAADAYSRDLEGLVYSWSFEDGGETYDIVDSPSASAVKTYSYGTYRVRVKVTASTGETFVCDLPEDIFVTIAKIFIDPSDPASPRLDEVLTNEYLDVGSVVMLRNGSTYEVDSEVTVKKPVRIEAEPGAGETFIRPLVAGNFRLLTLSDPGAVLSGFTLCGSTYQAVGLVGGGTVSNCVIRGNSSGTDTDVATGGAAVYVSGKGNLVTHCVITNNYISFAGGSIRMGAGVFVKNGAQCDIDNCVFRNNRIGTGNGAEKYGIAVCHEGSGRVRNCLFAENGSNPAGKSYDSHTHGALAVYGGNIGNHVDIENCTIAENRVGGANCAGLYTTGNTTVDVRNCLIAHNANASSVSNCEFVANATLTTCRITDDLKDFRRGAKGGFHLRGCSKAVNAGTFADWMTNATDLAGQPRIRQRAVDIGCHEDLETGFMIRIGGSGSSAPVQPVEPEPQAVTLPVLRVGIVSDVHINSDSDPNNSKTWGNSSNHLFERAITKFRDRGVDAIVVPGDMTENGGLNELENTELAWRRVFPDGDRDAFGNSVEKLFIRGNHDKMAGTNGQTEEELIRNNPSKAWKDVFGIDWYDRIMVRNVKGYVFILVDWDTTAAELDAFFVEHGADLPKDHPFFYVQHSAPAGTIGANPSATLGGCSQYLKNYPNCIALSGHSHDSITLGDQTWQGDFLSLGCGCLQYLWNREGRDNSWNLASGQVGHAVRCSSGGHQGMFLTIEADRIVVERWDIANDEKVGPDHVFPRDGTKPYSFEAQRARAVAPQFPQGATAVVSERDFHNRSSGEKWTDERQVIVTVPRAARCDTDEGRVYEYECVVYTDAGGEANPLIVRKVLAANWFLNDARVESETIIAFGKDELPAGVTLRFAVRPMDDWGNRGNPISATYVIAE